MSHQRTPQEVFEHHADRLAAADVDGILEDYSENAVLITPLGAVQGEEGLNTAFHQLLEGLPDARWEIRTVINEGEVLFVEWGAESLTHRVTDGVDTFVIRDGRIQVQTARFTMVPRDAE